MKRIKSTLRLDIDSIDYNGAWSSGIMRALALTLLVVTMLLCGACGTPLIEVPMPELDGVTEALGYSLAPTHMPEGFEFYQYDVFNLGPGTIQPDDQVVMPLGEPYAMVVYLELNHHVFIQYPQSFSPSVSNDFLLESLGIEWRRPDDAVSEVKVNGKAAYLVRGSWSAESLQKLGNPDPEVLATYTPSWDYDMYLSLFFDFELSQDETVGVMIWAIMLLSTEDWITAKEMVAIAESLRRVD
jgi:hypothetical protein